MKVASRIVIAALAVSALIAPVRAQEYFGDFRPDAPELAARGALPVGVRTLVADHADQLDVLRYSDANPNPRYTRKLTLEVWYPATLDVEAMNESARELLGLHDWAAYCRPREGATTIRELQEFSWRRDGTGVLIAALKADAFCHSMVRALVGASVSVGEHKLDGERLLGIRAAAQRTSEFKVMPAHGLTLVEVGYPEDVAARAAQTRARRDA